MGLEGWGLPWSTLSSPQAVVGIFRGCSPISGPLSSKPRCDNGKEVSAAPPVAGGGGATCHFGGVRNSWRTGRVQSLPGTVWAGWL